MTKKQQTKSPSENKESKGAEINVEDIDLERMKTLISEAPGSSEYAVERGGVAFAPTKAGAIKSRAFKVMDEQIGMQMDNIMEQIHVLARQAENLKVRQQISEEIYRSSMKFEPLVGDVYYLYKTPKGNVLSMLSPEEFGDKKLVEKSYSFEAKAKLLADCTWEVLEKAENAFDGKI